MNMKINLKKIRAVRFFQQTHPFWNLHHSPIGNNLEATKTRVYWYLQIQAKSLPLIISCCRQHLTSPGDSVAKGKFTFDMTCALKRFVSIQLKHSIEMSACIRPMNFGVLWWYGREKYAPSLTKSGK